MSERAVKLSAWPGFSLPDLDGVTDGGRTRRAETVDLDATYFDTADLRLARRGITLRHRRRGPRETWTVKLPAAPGAADAVAGRREVTLSGPLDTIPAPAALLVAAQVRTARLERVARLMTVRRRTVVDGPGGEPLAEVDDDEVSVMDGGRVAARFRELEVEIAPDVSAEVAAAIVARLRRAGAGDAVGGRKLDRAIGPWASNPPEAAPRPLPPQPTAADVVTSALGEAVTRILDHHAVAVLGDDPEGVHQVRVGVRRLRSHLRTFAPLLDRAATDPLRSELRWLAGALGEARDADVRHDRLAGAVAALPVAGDRAAAEPVRARLAEERDVALARVRGLLGSDRYLELLDRLVALAEDPPLGAAAAAAASDVLPGLVARPWKRLRRQVRALGAEPSDAELHEVRKAAKRVRDAAEAVAPVVGRPARRAAAAARAVQDLLGAHQDAVVAEAWLRDAAAAPGVDVGTAFALGALAAGERATQARLRAAWPDRWRASGRPARWRWVRDPSPAA